MEAKKLKKKKGAISKGKIKKTTRNVICRPDAPFWPDVSELQAKDIDEILKNYSVPIPNFVKPHWKEIKSLKKSERPKPPPIKKVDGLCFGLSEVTEAIQTKKVSVVIVESLINPRSIAQPAIDACIASEIPVICLKNLRTLCKTYFGIQASCLGVKSSLLDLSNKIKEISQNYKPITIKPKILTNNKDLISLEKDESMQVDEVQCNPYLYRTNKKSRVFVPSSTYETKDNNQFNGQQFIKISEKKEDITNSKTYMRMILKKISNNPNRVKIKK